MATFRVGIGSFNINDGSVGIGTEGSGHGNLKVEGVIKPTKNLDVLGVSTFTRYSGFSADEININNRDLTLSGEYSTTGDIVVEDGASLTVGLGSTACTGSVECISVKHHFSVPVGDTAQRNETSGYGEGTIRYNRDFETMEFFNGNEWRQFRYQADISNSPSSRGVCMLMSGDTPTRVDFAHYVNIMTQGNSIYFGDLNTAKSQAGGCGNEIRAMLLGGSTPSGNSNEIQYATIGTQGKFNDFGNLSSQRQTVAAVSTSVQATTTAGATSGDTVKNIIEFVNIMTIGDMIDFGDLQTSRRANGALGSPVRGVVVAGCTPTIFGNIEFFTPQSKGNATNWGEMNRKRSLYAFSNSVRGIMAGGFDPARLSAMEYLTIASEGTNASDFGDLTGTKDAGGANGHSSNQVRGLITGGYDGSNLINSIDFITIATTGNAQDFGDCSTPWGYVSNTTDSHGGLGGY